MARKTEKVIEKIEREYIIPLREKLRVVPRYRKTEKAIKTIKEFIARHMKVIDRDLKKVKLDTYLNEMLWMRGIKNPPHKVKVRAIKEGDIVRVEAVELPKNIKYKKLREEKVVSKAKEVVEKKKKEKEAEEKKEESKTEEETRPSVAELEKKEEKPAEEKIEETEKKEEEKEKKAAVIEAGKEMEKAAARQAKHEKVPKVKMPKHQRRMALQK